MMTEPKDKLLQAFNHMVDELHAAMEKAEETISPTIDEMVTNAEKISKKLYALTQDEARTVTEHLKRDIAHARDYMDKEGKDFKIRKFFKILRDSFLLFIFISGKWYRSSTPF